MQIHGTNPGGFASSCWLGAGLPRGAVATSGKGQENPQVCTGFHHASLSASSNLGFGAALQKGERSQALPCIKPGYSDSSAVSASAIPCSFKCSLKST